jgi:hypothetical protein
MLQYKIPQDVGIEDKIVGPLSLRQLIIVAIGVGISYVIYAVAAKLYELNTIEYIVIALPALIAVVAAFVRVNNVSFTKFVLLSVEYAIKPKRRLWDHRGIAHLVAPDLKEKKTGSAATVGEGKKRKDVNLDELSRILDSGGFENVKVPKHEDIDKVKDEDLMTEAYFGHKKSESQTENMYWRTKESQKKRLDILAKLPPVTKKQETAPKEAVKTEQTTPQEIRQAPPVAATKPVMKPQEQTPQTAKAPSPVRPEEQPAPTVQKVQPPVQQPIKPPTSPAAQQPTSQTQKPLIQKTEKPMPPVQAQSPTKPQTLKPETTKPQVQKPATTEVRKTPEIVPKKPETAPKAETKIQKPIVQPGKPTPAEAVPPKKMELMPQAKPQIPNQAQEGGKKKRRRNKKPKNLMPVRPETQINNTQKNKPITLMPKEKIGEKPKIQQEQRAKQVTKEQPAVKKDQPVQKDKPVQTDQTGGEIHLEELKKGEITWGF